MIRTSHTIWSRALGKFEQPPFIMSFARFKETKVWKHSLRGKDVLISCSAETFALMILAALQVACDGFCSIVSFGNTRCLEPSLPLLFSVTLLSYSFKSF